MKSSGFLDDASLSGKPTSSAGGKSFESCLRPGGDEVVTKNDGRENRSKRPEIL